MQKPIPVNLPALRGMAFRLAIGARESQLDIRRHTADVICAEDHRLFLAMVEYANSRAELSYRRYSLESLTQMTQDFVTSTRDVLKLRLGKRYSINWVDTGFDGTLEAPRTPAELLYLVEHLHGCLGLHPEYEVSQLNITAAQAGELLEQLGNAFTGVTSQKAVCAQLLDARNDQVKALRKHIRGLINELDYLLEPNDPRWGMFGLNMPDAKQRPDQPENVEVKLFENADAHLKWEAPARAQRYHIFQRIIGVDAEPVNVGTSYDPDFVLENLPAGATVEITIRALNDGGESTPSEMLTIQMD